MPRSLKTSVSSKSSSRKSRPFSWKKWSRAFGPGIITGGSDNDPAGIVTYSLAGALLGYAALWVLVLVTPLMVVLQEMAGRLAIVKKQGLAHIIKDNYGFSYAALVVFILAIANIATIAADLAGVAAIFGILFKVNFLYFIAPITLFVSAVILFEDYRHFKNLLFLLTALLVLYIFSALASNPDWSEVAKGLIPSFDNSLIFLGVVIGIIGTTISPYMLFWQASEEVEEHHHVLKASELTSDTVAGMSWSNIVAAFIMISAGTTLFATGLEVTNIIDISAALEPIAGRFAYLFFSLGIIASGFLALPVLAGSTAYAVSELFGWREGINKKFHLAKGFYLVITFSMVLGAIISFLPIKPIDFLYYTQILNGFLMPVLIFVLLTLCNDVKIMGQKFLNGPIKNSIASISLILIVILDVFLLLDLF